MREKTAHATRVERGDHGSLSKLLEYQVGTAALQALVKNPQPDVMALPLGRDGPFGLWFGMIFRRLVLVSAFLAAAVFGNQALADPYARAHPVVVELFTSQGCSDCPAADRILTELAKRKDVIALSLPITYWDMLGWKDTFATESNTKRQKAYARAMNRSGIYTPQMVVDGVLDVVGNKRERVMTAISGRASELPNEQSANLSLGLASGRVVISIAASHGKAKPLATIWVMRTLSQGAVNVQQGENKNRQLIYANLVRDVQRVGEWTGDEMKIDVPVALGQARQDGVAVILQSHDYGEVLAAAVMPVPSSYLVAAPR